MVQLGHTVENAEEIHSWRTPSHKTLGAGMVAIFRGAHLFWPSSVGEYNHDTSRAI